MTPSFPTRLSADLRKCRLELLAVPPAPADPIVFEQAGPRQEERAGAQSDQRDAASCSLLQKRDRACRYPLAAMKKTSDDDDIIKSRGVSAAFVWPHFDTAT